MPARPHVPLQKVTPQPPRSTTKSQVFPTVAYTLPGGHELVLEVDGTVGSIKAHFGGSDRIGIPKSGNACRIPLACQLELAVSAKSRSFRH